MATSTFPRVKAALVEKLTDANWPSRKPTVSYGWPRTDTREIVAVGGTTSSEQRWAQLGARRRDEDYRIEVAIMVTTPGQSQQSATERAFELLGVIENELRDDPGLGLEGVICVEVADPQVDEAPDTDGYIALVITGIRVTARI
jgi:hypothetical protein